MGNEKGLMSIAIFIFVPELYDDVQAQLLMRLAMARRDIPSPLWPAFT